MVDSRMEDEIITKEISWCRRTVDMRMEDEIITKEISWCRRTVDMRMEDEITVLPRRFPGAGEQ